MARLREFEIEDAVEGVMGVFWRNGYDGASMQDIEAATGLNKQSLYRVFPDKRAMYLAALARYERNEVEKTAAVLAGGGSAKSRFGALFGGVVARATKGDRTGCFLCNAALDQAQRDDETRALVSAAMVRIEKLFREALSASAPYDRSPARAQGKAAELLAAYCGLRVLTRASAPLRLIKAAADAAVAAI